MYFRKKYLNMQCIPLSNPLPYSPVISFHFGLLTVLQVLYSRMDSEHVLNNIQGMR